MTAAAPEQARAVPPGGPAAGLLFEGPGEMRALCRALDWSATPLGPVEGWSQSLRTVARTLLGSRSPMFLFWGPELVQLYNDAYRPSLGGGGRHPRALGMRGREFWTDIWEVIGPQIEQVMTTGVPTWHEDQYLPIERNGRLEDVWWTYSYSPAYGDDGSVAGTLVICQETTPRVLADRDRERLLAELRVERARLAEVFRQSPSFLAVLRGPDNVFELVNDAYEQAIGRGRAVVGKPLFEALPETRGQGFDEYLRRVRETGEPLVFRDLPVLLERMPGAPLEERFIDITYLPLAESGPAGEAIRDAVIAHGTDVTEQVHVRREVERARDRADRLLALTAALAATGTPEEVAGVVVAQGVAAAGAATGMLALRTPHTGEDGEAEMAILGHSGLGGEIAARYARVPVSAPVPTAASVRTGEAFFLEERPALFAAFPAMPHVWESLGAHALATVPLVVGGEAVGAMSFTFTAPRRFPPEDREFFLAAGRQAAQALERARLAEAEHTARLRAEALQRVTAALAGAQTLADVGRVFSRELTRLIGADTAWVGAVTPDGDAVEALGWSGYAEGEAEGWRRLPLDAGIALTDAVRSGRPQWWPTREALADAYPERAALIRSLPQDGVTVLPIPGAGGQPEGDAVRAVGGIVVGFRTPQRFDPDTRAFFLALAQQCAQAMARAGAYQAEQAARAEAEAANRAKSQFLATMSHELRTPLNAIGGYAELLEMGIRGPVTDTQREDLHRIQQSQRHLLGLINEVLNYARLETGTVRYELEDVPVRETVAAAESLVAPQARSREVQLEVAECPSDLAVRADPEKLRQILVNLLSNAVKFTGARGRVEVSCAREEATVRVVVRDTGIGIPADKLEAIFDPFVQVRSDLTRTHEGTGLGLAISRDLARGMAGELTAESTTGSGSAFTLTLPAA
jgi:signal transduction histidine kinase